MVNKVRSMLWSIFNSDYRTTRLLGSYQIDVVKDFSGAVHLSQYDNHLVVYKLLELSQVTHHLPFQLSSDLARDVKNSGEATHINYVMNNAATMVKMYYFYSVCRKNFNRT